MPVVGIAGIGALVVAVVALLLLLGAPLFVRLFNATVGRLPLVGGYVAGYMTDAFNWATSGLMSLAQSWAHPVVDLWWGFLSAIWALPSAAADTFGALVAAVGRVADRLSSSVANLNGAIGATTQSLYNTIVKVGNDAHAYTLAMFTQVESDLGTWAGSLYNTIVKVGNDAHAYALSVFNQVESDLGAWVQSLTDTVAKVGADAYANARAMFNIAEADIAATAAKASHDLSMAVAAVEGYATTAAAGAAATLERELDQAAHDVVIGPWAALLPDLEAIVEHLPAIGAPAIPGLPTITEPIPISLPGVLAILSTATAVVARETARCTVPMCENLGGLSGLLGGLEGDLVWAALLALVAESVHDPAAAVSGLRGTVSPIVEATARDVTNLVGV